MQTFFESSEINVRMRGILVDWIVLICDRFALSEHTLHLSIAILDKYCMCQLNNVIKKNYQLLGCTSVYIACKIEEVTSPELNDFVYISNNAFQKKDMLECENIMLEKLNYNVMLSNLMTTYDCYSSSDRMTKYYLDLILLNTSLLYDYEKEDLVESCIELSQKTGNYWSACMDAIQVFEKMNVFAEVKNKYQVT